MAHGHIPTELLRTTLRIRREAALVRTLAGKLGDERDLPPEVTEALAVLVRWAARVAASTEPGGRPETNSGP
jgi:hypothetical protein